MGNTWLYNDRYLYYLTLSLAPYTRTQGMRLDLQTGETEPWDIPAETTAVFAPLGDSLLTTRIVSDRPVPFPDDPEMSEAFLQNSEREYDITDAATGKPVKKLLSYPWYGQPDGDGLLNYSCIGTSGEDIYFCVEHLLPFEDSYRLDGLSLLCIHSDGTQTDLGMLPGNLCEAIPQGDDLRWIVSGSFEEYIIYDLQGQELGRNRLPAEKGASSVTLLRLLDDGRLLLSVGYDADHNNVMRLATIDADAFLNGSTDYQEIAFIE